MSDKHEPIGQQSESPESQKPTAQLLQEQQPQTEMQFRFECRDIERIDQRNLEYQQAREARESMGLSPEPESTVLEQEYLANAEKFIENERKKPDFPMGTSVDFTMLLADVPDREELVHRYPGREKEIDVYIQRLQNFDTKYKNGYTDILLNNFNGAVSEGTFQWMRMEHNGQVDYTEPDKVIDFLRAHPELQNNFRGHNVFWNRTRCLPEDLRGQTKEDIRKAVIEQRLEILKRYPGIKEWDLVNEPLSREPRLNNNGVDQDEVVFDPEKDFDFFVELFKRAKEIAPDTKLYANEYSILSGNQCGNYVKFIQKLIEAGAPIDGIGVQGHITEWDTASITQMKENLDDLAKLGLPIKITEFDISDEVIRKTYFPRNKEEISEKQMEEARADYTKKALTIFYGNPKVNGIFQWGFQDKSHWRSKDGEHCGLFDDNFQPNEVGKTFQNLTQNRWKLNVGNKNKLDEN